MYGFDYPSFYCARVYVFIEYYINSWYCVCMYVYICCVRFVSIHLVVSICISTCVTSVCLGYLYLSLSVCIHVDEGAPLPPSCQVALHWQNRLRVTKVFRDPNSYEPNINLI